MAHYIHHVPGRLRVKSERLKRHPARQAEARALLAGMPGIEQLEINGLTGSVLVRYDRQITRQQDILTALKGAGLVAEVAPAVADVQPGDPVWSQVPSVGESLGKALFGIVLEKAVERSAVALIGALL